MPPKKVLVVRQRLKSDGSVTLEPVEWKDASVVNKQQATRRVAPSSLSQYKPSGESVAEPVPVSTTQVTTFLVNADDDDVENVDVDFLSSAPCDTESVAESVDNDKMLNFTAEPIERDWISGDFGSEVIDEMLGSGFAVSTNQEENLVPELGITEPIEDATLAAIKYSPEKSMSKKNKKRPIREPRPTVARTNPTSPRRTIPVTYPRKCELCEKLCHTKNQHKSHRVYHHTSQKFALDGPEDKRQCEFCDKTFSMKAAFVKHQRTMHWKELDLEEPRFPCRWCDRVYVASSSRIYHEMTVHRPKSFPCPLCGLNFKLYENLNKHLKTHNASCLRCFKCHNLFTNVDSLRRHFENKHPDTEFDESMVTTNDNAHRRLVNGQAFVPRKTRAPATMAFESVEKLDEFLKSNPNYQIVQTDENGQLTYHLVETLESTETVVTDQSYVHVATDEQASDKSGDVAHVNTIFMETNGADESGTDSVNVLCENAEVEIPEFELDQVEEALANIPNLRGKLAYRCQMCSMVFNDTGALMKHCLVRHQEIAQVVLL